MKFRRQPKPSRKNDRRKSKNRPSKLRAKLTSFAQRRFRPLMELLEDRRLLTTHVWQGPAAGGVWSNAANWTNGAPAANDTVQFSSNGGVSSTDDLAGLVLNEVHFTVGGNTILGAGGGVTLGIAGFGNDLVNDTGTNTIDRSLPIVNSAGITYVLTSAGQLNLNSVISGPEAVELRPGSALGTLQLGEGLGNDSSNTYAGDTFVDDGTVLLNKNGGAFAAQAIPHNLIVGDFSGAANSAVVRELHPNEIDAGATVTVESDGLFDTNGNTDNNANRIATLTVFSGNVATGVGAVNPTGTMSLDSANATLTVNATGTSGGSASFNGAANFNFAGINALSFKSNSGTSNLTINNPAGGLFAPAGGITDTGAGVAGNSLSDLGGGSGATDAGVYTPTGLHSGTLKHTEGATVQTITFSGLTPATDTVSSATFAINGSGSASGFGVVDGAVLGTTTVTDTTAESMTFANKTVVNINGNNAADTFTVNNPNPATGLTTLNLNGGATSGDVVNLQATGGTVTTNWFANGGTALPNATVNVGKAGSLQGIKGTINLEAPLAEYNAVVVDNSADVTGRAVTLSTFVQAGLGEAGINWGKIHGLSASADINYSFGDTRILTIDGGAGGNTWTVNATAGAQSGGPQRTNTINAGNGGDSFAISASGMGVNPVGGAHFNSDNFFNGGTGNDTFTVTGSLAGDTNTTLHINGNAPTTAPGDVLNVPANSVVTPNGPGSGTVGTSVGSPANVVTSYASIETVAAASGTYSLNINTANFGEPDGGAADTENLIRNGSRLEFRLDGTLEGSYDYASISTMSITGSSNNDTLTVDNSQGNAVPTGGLSFDGGTGLNTIISTGGNFLTGVSNPTGPHAGSVTYAGGTTGAAMITYTNLAPFTDSNVIGTFTVNGTAAADTINIVNLAAGNGTQVNSGVNNTFELWNLTNKTTIDVNGVSGVDTFTVNNPTPDAALTTLNVNGGTTIGDVVNVLKTPATVTTNWVGGKTTTVNVGNAGSAQGILGTLNIENPPSFNTIVVDDSADVGVRTATLSTLGTNPEDSDGNSDPYGQIVGLAPAQINYEYFDTSALTVKGSAGGTTFNVQNTGSGFVTTLDGGAGPDTFNVSSTAPALTGNLEGINGELDINSGAGVDHLNVSDLSGPGGATYTLSQVAGATTLATSTVNVANIVYDANGTAGQLENFSLVGSSAGGNTYNIDLTSATVSNTFNDGIGGNSGGFSTFNIDANNLQSGASNTFNSFGGSDTFNMNLNGSFIPTAAGTTAVINGDGSAAGLDVVNVNTQTAAANFVGINYGAGDQAFVTGLGTDLAGPGIQVNNTRQINYNGSSANADTLTVTSPTAGTHTVSVTPISANSANVFLDGTPLLTGTNSPTNNPGVAGGGAGPDVFLQGVAQNSFLVQAGSASDNKLIVNGTSENNNGAAGTSAWGGNAFGSPPDFYAAPNAYNTIGVTDSQVAIFSTGPGTLLNVNYVNAGFQSTASPAVPTVIVNSGDQAGEQANGIADNITVTLSAAIRFQINGGLPGLTMVGGIPQGDQLNVATVGAVNVYSDGANPPNVSINSAIAGTLPVTYTSIERLNVIPGNGIVNIIGDNNVAGNNQNDYFKVRGGPDLLDSPVPSNGVGQFSLQIGGDWNPTTGAKDLSSPIYFQGVTRINASGGAAASFDAQGNAIPDTADPAGVNALDITPYADNIPEGWGIQTYWNQGNFNTADGGIDLLTFNGVLGVSDKITVTPSAPKAGQVSDINAATGTPIAVVNYTNNTNIIVNASSPPGTPGDSDTLTLGGTNPNNPTTSGDDNFVANFNNVIDPLLGTAGHEMVKVTDAVGGAALYNLQTFSNFNTLNVAMGGGIDTFELKAGRTDGSLGLNVGGGPGVNESIQVDGSATSGDFFQITPGATSDAGTIATLLNVSTGTTAPTMLNYTGTSAVNLVGQSGGGSDALFISGTGGNVVFSAQNSGVGATFGTTQVNAGPVITYTGLGAGPGTVLLLNGTGGSDSYTLTQGPGPIPNVVVNGGAANTVALTGTGGADSFTFTPTSANSATLTDTLPGPITTYSFSGTTSLSLNGVSLAAGATLTVTPTSAIITPGSSTGSGTVTATNASHQALLPLSYTNISAATVSGGTLVVDATDDNDTVSVDAAGNVTVLNRSTLATNTYAAGGYTGLVIDVSGDNGLVNIAPSAFFVAGGIHVFGDSDGSGNTMLTYTGGGGVVNVDIDNRTISEGGDTVVGFSGVGTVNTSSTNALGVNFIGVTGSETLAVTPTGVGSATVMANGAGPLYVVTSAPHLTSTFSGIGNTLVFNGNSAGEAFSATPGLIGVPADMQMFYAPGEFSSVTFNGLGGNNQFTVDSSTGPVTAPIIFNGGTGSGNSLVLTGGVATNDVYGPGPGAGEGTDTLTFLGGTQRR